VKKYKVSRRGAIPSSLFNHDWNFARVTARGFRDANEHLSVGFAPAGFTVRLR
jgi:hypothetical protein